MAQNFQKSPPTTILPITTRAKLFLLLTSALLSLHVRTLEPKMITHPCFIDPVRCISVRTSISSASYLWKIFQIQPGKSSVGSTNWRQLCFPLKERIKSRILLNWCLQMFLLMYIPLHKTQ